MNTRMLALKLQSYLDDRERAAEAIKTAGA
jgi:hypothetical protein